MFRIVEKIKNIAANTNTWQRVVFGVALLIGVQFAIPADFVPLRATLDGKHVGVARLSELKDRVATGPQEIPVTVGKTGLEIQAGDLGLKSDAEKTAEQVPTISLLERIVPLGVVAHFVRSPDIVTVRSVDEPRLAKAAEELAKKYTKPAVDATATIVNGNLQITEAASGQKVTTLAVRQAIVDSIAKRQTKIDVAAVEVKPVVQASDFTDVKSKYDQLAPKSLAITFGTSTVTYDAAQLRKWLVVKKDDKTNKWQLVVTKEALASEAEQWSKAYNVPAGTTQVTTMDGVETSRTNGAAGRAIDTDKVLEQLTAWLNKPEAETIQLASKTLAPQVVVSRYYSESSAALQAKLNDWIAGHPGSYQVAIVELGGQGRKASHNVSQQTVMASTYKLFVAYAVYKQSEIGALDLNTKLSTSNSANGLTIEQCIGKAIINSDNDCAIALGKYVGWAKCDQIVAAAGFKNVRLNNYNANGSLNGDKMVNADELASFLAQLSAGSLMNGGSTGKLLGYMKSQVYREGIPAGSHGSVVADKVGFLEGYLHDAAIVYSPKATYALVIMSSGSSWKNISNLADAIYDFMN